MRRTSIVLGAFVLLLALCGVAGAVVITYDHALDSNGGFTSGVAGATVENFNSGFSQSSWTWSGDYARVQGTTSNYAAPAGDQTGYMAVPYANSNGAATIQFHQTYTYFGLWWGSVDSYNSIEFYNNGSLVAGGRFSGSDITNPANGNQAAPSTNLYVNFFNLPAFNSVRLISSNYAFEVDNIAVANSVPEPHSMLLLGSGLVGFVALRRKIRNA